MARLSLTLHHNHQHHHHLMPTADSSTTTPRRPRAPPDRPVRSGSVIALVAYTIPLSRCGGATQAVSAPERGGMWGRNQGNRVKSWWNLDMWWFVKSFGPEGLEGFFFTIGCWASFVLLWQKLGTRKEMKRVGDPPMFPRWLRLLRRWDGAPAPAKAAHPAVFRKHQWNLDGIHTLGVRIPSEIDDQGYQ